MDEIMLNTLIALAEAHEGRVEINHSGIRAFTTDDDLNVTVHLEDGRQLPPEQVDAKMIDDAIYHWRGEHQSFFQQILGAMM